MTHLVDDTDRAARLKSLTHEVHDRLDKRIMAADPFASQDNYLRFLRLQYLFHRHVDALYAEPRLAALIPDLAGRRRLELVVQDLADLGAQPPVPEADAHFAPGRIDLAEALGWLYVAEGSNLGAAFLLKYAGKLGFDARLGARHLAPADAGRAPHWRTFKQALDSVALSPEDEGAVSAGATAAFRCVHALVDTQFSAAES